MQASHHVLSLVALKLYLAKHLPIDFTKKFNFLVRDKPDGPSYVKLDAGRELSQKLSPLVTEDDVTAIQTSFSVTDGLRQLRTRKWGLSDLQYVFLAAMTIGSLWIIEPAAPFLKTLAFLGFVLLLSTPATNQFFLPSWPIWAYLLFFFSSRFVPNDVRPLVSVKVLPALEDIMYGADLSNILSEYTNPVLDLFAWFPYGIGHFGLPAVCSAVIFWFGAPGTVRVFAGAFGYMNMIGVATQLVFPCTPPWYEKLHGLEPAEYGMQGSPAGLARIDALFGVDLYTTSFTTAPVPFGAFPSLHAGAAVIEALFIGTVFPRLRGFCAFYVAWLCWATMYLNHHYAVDLVGGAILATTIYLIARARWLPRQQHDKANRWEYTFVERGHVISLSTGKRVDDEEMEIGLRRRDSDNWSDRSSASYRSYRSSSSSASSSATTLCVTSPVTTPDENHWITRESAFAKRSS